MESIPEPGTHDYELWLREQDPTIPKLPPTDFTDEPKPFRSAYVTDWDDLINVDEPEYLVDSFLIKGQVTWLYGATGIGKSLVMLGAALDISEGKPVFGRYDSQQANVLWLDYENGSEIMMSRIDSYGRDRFGLAAGHHFHIGSLVDPATYDPENLIATCKLREIGLLVIDSSGVGISGDSNAADTFADFARTVLNPLKKMGVTVVVLDNMGKDASREAIGSSRKQHEAGVLWKLSLDHFGVKLTNRKSRHPGMANVISLVKHVDPLRFSPAGIGISPTAEQMVKDVAEIGYDGKLTRDNVKNALIEAGKHTPGNKYISEAMQALKAGGLQTEETGGTEMMGQLDGTEWDGGTEQQEPVL